MDKCCDLGENTNVFAISFNIPPDCPFFNGLKGTFSNPGFQSVVERVSYSDGGFEFGAVSYES